MADILVAVDEAGSFSDTLDAFSGIGALLVPWDEETRRLIKAGVEAIERSAAASQLSKHGELKGTKLSDDQFRKACELVRACSGKLCVHPLRTDADFSMAPTEDMVACFVDTAGRIGTEATTICERLIQDINNYGPHSKVYAGTVLQLFQWAVAPEVFAGPRPEKTWVVFDDLSADRKLLAELHVNLAFAFHLRDIFGRQDRWVFGLGDPPFAVIPRAAEHREPLALVDWMIHPHVAMRKHGMRLESIKALLRPQDGAKVQPDDPDEKSFALEMQDRVHLQYRLGFVREVKVLPVRRF